MHLSHRTVLLMAAALGLAACDSEPDLTTPADVEPAFGKSGFITSEPLQAAFGPGFSGTMTAIVTVDDAMPGGESLAGTLDGIGIWGGSAT